MSSIVNFRFDRGVAISEWLDFVAGRDIRYSPNTVGQSTFYAGATEVRLPGGHMALVSGVEISLDGKGTVDENRGGRIDWSTARPPETFASLSVRVSGGPRVQTLEAVLEALAGWQPVRIYCSPELDHMCVGIPRYSDLEHSERLELMSTDFAAGWSFADGVYSARVEAGEALVSPREDGTWSLSVSGVERAAFRDLDTAFAFAGRCDWDWWEGEEPSPQAAPTLALR